MKPERSIMSALCILVASQLFSPVETIQAAEIKAVDPGEKSPEIGKALDIKFISLDGRLVDLRALKGKVVLIDFWATWCPPCARQFSKIKQTYEKYHDRGLEIVGISLDEEKDALQDFLKKHGPAPWPQYFDGQGWKSEISLRFGINAIPTLWIVDKKGILRSTRPSRDGEDLILVEDYLQEQD